MKVAFLADVAANLPAFEAALDRAKRWRADEVVLLGDLVAAGPHPAEVVALARKRGLAVIAGLSDRAVAAGGAGDPSLSAVAARLDASALRWLATLPPSRRVRWGRFLVRAAGDGSRASDEFDVAISAGPRAASVRALPKGRFEIDAGSVGRPSGGPEAEIVLCDFERGAFEIARAAFDVDAFETALREARAEWLIVADSGFHAKRGA